MASRVVLKDRENLFWDRVREGCLRRPRVNCGSESQTGISVDHGRWRANTRSGRCVFGARHTA